MFDYGSLITGGAQLLGSVIGASSNSNLNSANRKFQHNEATLAYMRQKELFTKYTSTAAQMDAARRAGYNPNYLLQNGMSGSAPSVASANTPETYGSGDVLQRGISNAAMSVFQAQNLQSQTGKNNAEANSINLKTPKELEKLGYDSETAKNIARYAGANQEMDLQLKNQELQLKTAQTATEQAMAQVYHWQALNSKYEFENLKPLQMQEMQTQICKDIAQIGLLVAQKQLTEEQAKLAIADTYKAYSDAVSNRISANAQQTGANAQMMNAQTNRAEMNSRIDLNYSMAENQSAQAVESGKRSEGLDVDNDTKKKVQGFVIQSMETSTEILGKQNAWFNARQVGGMIKDVGVGIGSAIGGVASAATSIGKLGL